MGNILSPVLDTIDGLLGWIGTSFGQLTETYCMLETAEDNYTLVAKDGSLVSLIKISGATYLVGPEEFDKIHRGITTALQSALASSGHTVQLVFTQDKAPIEDDLSEILEPAKKTAERLSLSLDDLFEEKVQFLKQYCSSEEMLLVLWTRPGSMTKTQAEQSAKNRKEEFKGAKFPPLKNAQNIFAGIPEIRDTHHSFVKIIEADINTLGIQCELLEVHKACYYIRKSVDPDFTAKDWQPILPGDKIPVRESRNFTGEVSDILWPPLQKQLFPRNAENLDLRTVRIGDKIYGSVFLDIFPKEIQAFISLFRRLQGIGLSWRISYTIDSDGMSTRGLKPMLATILSFASSHNKLINQSMQYLDYVNNNTDESIVRLRVTATTWTEATEEKLLRSKLSELAKTIQGWGYVETSEVCGDPLAGVISSAVGLTTEAVGMASIAPLSDVVYMMPLTRPASPWEKGAVLFRSPDGKPWPYQPGSTLQTTWIDLVYARPGSGKSVLSNSINLALCLSGGISRLPRISIIDIGPSSSGLISLIKESLPEERRHEVAYHRLRMVKEMSINPFDTQLGCRYPSPQDRAFLVNFISLLATPVGEEKTYDGIYDMAGMIVDELYKNLDDSANPNLYSSNLCPQIDIKINQININIDSHTTWWEITDALFENHEIHLATIAQRYAMPLLSDAVSICRNKNIEDLYGSITAPTGEKLIEAFSRMISSSIREYPILANITSFDLGEARIVSLDLDEVAKSGGDAADRQTAVMYMLARYILARHYYLTEDNAKDLSDVYKEYHDQRIKEIREDPKRIVFDEFHRTSKAKAVRDQVLIDMREGRKWKVQVSLLSQSLDDFDPVMIEFATAIFIMDAGPKQAIERSCEVFGLSETAKLALSNRVHGPREGGATFLAVFSTKMGVNTQLITSTIGPVELWSFNTTAEDVRIRNVLYEKIGASQTRKLLAKLYPSGSAAKIIEQRLADLSGDESEIIDSKEANNVIDQLINEIYERYQNDPKLQ